MAKWTREIAVRVFPEGKNHPELAVHIAAARTLAGAVAQKAQSSGLDYHSDIRRASDGTLYKAAYINNREEGYAPQVLAEVYLQPEPKEKPIDLPERPDPAPPPPPPPPPPPTRWEGTIAFFVGDETHPVYHATPSVFEPTDTYILDEARLREEVLPLIQQNRVGIGILHIKTQFSNWSYDTHRVAPIPPYAIEVLTDTWPEPPLEEYKRVIDAVMNSLGPPRGGGEGRIERAYFFLDNSGSVRISTLPDGVAEYLESAYNISDLFYEASPTERWIDYMFRFLTS